VTEADRVRAERVGQEDVGARSDEREVELDELVGRVERELLGRLARLERELLKPPSAIRTFGPSSSRSAFIDSG
jgi:hypothetical protein